MFELKMFFKRLGRGLSWFWMMFKAPYWNEYDLYLSVMINQLITMANEFEAKPLTESSLQDAKRMRLAAKLLQMYRDEYYLTQVAISRSDTDTSAKYALDELRTAQAKDEKALKLAFRIIGQDLPGWWQ